MTARILLVSILCIFAANLVGVYFGLYWRVQWYDIPMHLAGGAWIALLFFYLFEERRRALHGASLLTLLAIVLGSVVLVGVLWEVYEYAMDVFVLRKFGFFEGRQEMFDTLADILNGLIGGAAVVFGRAWARKEPRVEPYRVPEGGFADKR